MTHTAVRKPGNLNYAHEMPCSSHASMHSAPLRKKSDALRSSARSGYLIWRLRHAVSRPCDAICAVLEPSAVLRVVHCSGAAATHPVLRRADRRRVEPTAPIIRRLSPPDGCGGCSVRGKPGRCLRVRHRCLRAFSRGPSTGLGIAGFAIRSRRDRRRPRASPRSPNGPTRARLKPSGSPAATRMRATLDQPRRTAPSQWGSERFIRNCSIPTFREWFTSLGRFHWARGGARSSFAAEIVL
jgi:hypothetical protein